MQGEHWTAGSHEAVGPENGLTAQDNGELQQFPWVNGKRGVSAIGALCFLVVLAHADSSAAQVVFREGWNFPRPDPMSRDDRTANR